MLALALVLCVLGLPGTLGAQQRPGWEIEALNDKGWAEFDFQTGLGGGTGGVLVRYGSAFLTADQVSVNQESGEVVADGDVRIQSEEQLWAGEHIRYNFKTHQMEAEQFRTGKTPVFIAAEGLLGEITNRVYNATNAVITTDDVSVPAVTVRAKYIKIVPGEKVEAHHATLYLAGVPVFYFPYYSRTLGPRSNNFNFLPGYRSSYGPFLLSRYNYFIGDDLDGTARLDYRERRGFGLGPDLNYRLGRYGEGTVRYYYMHDQDPGAGGGDPTMNKDRERVDFAYQVNPATNLNIKAVVRYQGDTNIVREFFEGEYNQNPQPSTYFEVNRFWQNFSLDTYVQPQVNGFLDTIERLPDVRLNGQRQQLWETPVYYESESSAGYYEHNFGTTNGMSAGEHYEAARVDTYQKLLLPETFFGWLDVTPRVGGRYTYYSTATGPGATTDEINRWVFDTGAEASAKASRLWPEAQNDFFQVDGLRHIIEPSINYAFVPNPNVYGTNLVPQFDYVMPSLRLLPITMPDYNSIDSIQSENVFRFGLHNKLQTKREGQMVNLVDWNVYSDWYLHPNTNQTTYSDVYSDLTVRPRTWLTLESLTRYEIQGGELRMSLTTATIRPNNTWSWTIGQFYLRDDLSASPTALGIGNNLFTSTMLFRLNENWGFRTMHMFEARTGTMQEQDYSIYRDLRSWTAALTFRARNGVAGSPNDIGVVFTFSLKASPHYGRGPEVGTPYWLMGG
jgi:lipopolysaccharide assembly outer membrane protein LptD (OstA)